MVFYLSNYTSNCRCLTHFAHFVRGLVSPVATVKPVITSVNLAYMPICLAFKFSHVTCLYGDKR